MHGRGRNTYGSCGSVVAVVALCVMTYSPDFVAVWLRCVRACVGVCVDVLGLENVVSVAKQCFVHFSVFSVVCAFSGRAV